MIPESHPDLFKAIEDSFKEIQSTSVERDIGVKLKRVVKDESKGFTRVIQNDSSDSAISKVIQ